MIRGLACTLVLVAASPADAARPVLAGEATFGVANGAFLVHYATTGGDAAPAADLDGDAIPDFVTEVAEVVEDALPRFAALGFRAPLSDGALGGDGRIDIYLRDLAIADGNTGIDQCTGTHCVGYIVAENDFAGFSYPTVGEGIRSVAPHELFHLIQHAYAAEQSPTWTEGSAVWSVEHLYGDGNADFERFLPTFLSKTFRPFERPATGFGDGYPYGAALWPYFLEQRFGAAAVVAAWTACETMPFADTIDDAAWIEFTRWNQFAGTPASSGGYPAAASFPRAPREPTIDPTIDPASATIYVEGLSARYVPLALATAQQVEIDSGPIAVAAWIVPTGGSLDAGIELAPAAGSPALVATVGPGDHTLVVTGLGRNTLAAAVTITLGEPPVSSDDSGSCQASPDACFGLVGFLMLVVVRRRGYRPATRAASS